MWKKSHLFAQGPIYLKTSSTSLSLHERERYNSCIEYCSVLYSSLNLKSEYMRVDKTQVLKVLDSYETSNEAKGPLGLHRFIEAMKHMFAIRMNLGDPDFVNITKTISEMLSSSFAKKIQQRIFDNTTFPSEYYMPRLRC